MSYQDDKNFHANELLENRLKKLPYFCRDFFVGIELNTSPLTRLNYANDLILFFEYVAKIYPFPSSDPTLLEFDVMNKITSNDINYFLSYISTYKTEDGKLVSNGEKGKKRKLSAIRALFKYFFRNDRLQKDVASKVSTPKIHLKPIVTLDSEEISDLFDAVENQKNEVSHQDKYNAKFIKRDTAILTLLLGTGIRVSELVGLNLNDIDFDNKKFKVTRKGGDQSILYLSDEVFNALKEYFEERKDIDTFLPTEEAFFLSSQRKRITARSVENLVKKYASSSVPLKHITPHKFRSTYGTSLYGETGDIYIVAEVLGHKDVNTTKRHYAAISDDIKKKAAGAVVLRPDKNKK